MELPYFYLWHPCYENNGVTDFRRIRMSFQFHHSCVAVVRKYSCLHQDFLTGESGDERVEGMQHSGVGCRRDHVDLSEQWIFTRIDVGLIRLVFSDRVEIISSVGLLTFTTFT